MAIKRFQSSRDRREASRDRREASRDRREASREKRTNKRSIGGQLEVEKKGSNKGSIDPQLTPNREVEIEVPPWRCPVCDLLPETLLRKVEVTWLDSKLDRPRKLTLARRLIKAGLGDDVGAAVEAIDRHVDVCLRNQHRSRYARVTEQFNMLWEALHVAHRVYLSNPDMFSATSYAGFVKQLRGLLGDLDKVQNAAELSQDLVRIAVNPMVRALTNAIISESGRLKEDLGQRIPEADADRLINEFVKRIATPFSRAARVAGEGIESTLAARDKNRVGAVVGKPPAKRRSTGKKTPLRVVK